MRKLYNIAKGWFIFLFYKRSQMSKTRLAICWDCPYRLGVFCNDCGCELHAKSEIEEEECPKGFWNLKTPGNYQQPGV